MTATCKLHSPADRSRQALGAQLHWDPIVQVQSASCERRRLFGQWRTSIVRPMSQDDWWHSRSASHLGDLCCSNSLLLLSKTKQYTARWRRPLECITDRASNSTTLLYSSTTSSTSPRRSADMSEAYATCITVSADAVGKELWWRPNGDVPSQSQQSMHCRLLGEPTERTA